MLSEDLVAVRKFRKLTVRDIYDATRIPLEVIEEIESGYVFTPECHRNKTYVRSFVRTYAKALRISENDATVALDLTEKGEYDGFIRRGYLPNADPQVSSAEKPQPVLSKTEPRITAERASSMIDYKDEVSRPDPTRPHNKATPPPPDLKSINWVDMGNKFNTFSRANKILYAIVGGIAAILLVGYLSLKLFGDNASKPENQVPTKEELKAVQDSLAAAAADTAAIQLAIVEPPPPPALPDTLSVFLFATGDKLEGVRIRTEQTGLIAPYWIEKNHAMKFEFTDAIYIKSQLNRITVIFNGHAIKNLHEMKRVDGAVVLDRAFFESKKEWLTPRSLDSLAVKPVKYVPRPVYKKESVKKN